jgi:hypothetical protein
MLFYLNIHAYVLNGSFYLIVSLREPKLGNRLYRPERECDDYPFAVETDRNLVSHRIRDSDFDTVWRHLTSALISVVVGLRGQGFGWRVARLCHAAERRSVMSQS